MSPLNMTRPLLVRDVGPFALVGVGWAQARIALVDFPVKAVSITVLRRTLSES